MIKFKSKNPSVKIDGCLQIDQSASTCFSQVEEVVEGGGGS